MSTIASFQIPKLTKAQIKLIALLLEGVEIEVHIEKGIKKYKVIDNSVFRFEIKESTFLKLKNAGLIKQYISPNGIETWK